MQVRSLDHVLVVDLTIPRLQGCVATNVEVSAIFDTSAPHTVLISLRIQKFKLMLLRWMSFQWRTLLLLLHIQHMT
jgi:hypothetical protein